MKTKTLVRPRVKPSGPCSFGGCDAPCRTMGYCKSHYDQQYNGREMRIPKQYFPADSRNEHGHKLCRTCNQWLPEAGFASSSGKIDGLQSRCRGCNAAIYQSRRDLVRDKMRQQRFGITRQEFDALFASQGNVCALCGTDNPGRNYWAVDHDHACCPSTDKTCGRCIRGILCGLCNHGLGAFRDSAEVLRKAAEYLDARAAVTRGAR